MPKKGFQYKKTKAKHWVYSAGRKSSIAKAQKVHSILVNIGKKYRNKEAHRFKLLGKG
jgi:hypothetical protein